MSFSMSHEARIRVPQDGFTLEDLQAYARRQKVPKGAKWTPTLMGNAMDPVGTNDEIAFVVEWVEEE